MSEIHATNVNQAFPQALNLLLDEGVQQQSRNGSVFAMQEPVLVTYTRPAQRVLFCEKRRANPFFHLMESIWMLAGRDDAAFVRTFNSRMGEYTDDGAVIPGAYGQRWRRHFGLDQLSIIIAELRAHTDSRRAVLAMWDPKRDGPAMLVGTADVPCNTHVYFDRRGDVLNMTVLNRSNDAIWGAFGANVVHFSVLMEYVAASLHLPMGKMRQFTNNLHVYDHVYSQESIREMATHAAGEDLYAHDSGLFTVHESTVVSDPEWFLKECELFCNDPQGDMRAWSNKFFTDTAQVMFLAWVAHKQKDDLLALRVAEGIEAEDWRVACLQWLNGVKK